MRSEQLERPPDEYLTVNEVSRLLRCDPATVRRMILAGRLAAIDLAGPGATTHTWRIPPAALAAAR